VSDKNLTYGLTHIAIRVSDIEQTLNFYKHIFNVEIMYHNLTFAQVRTPDTNDIIVFEKSKSSSIGKMGGVVHFGFRLKTPESISIVTAKVKEAGGVIKEQGEFVPGEPYIFFNDPDGYEIEVWYELPEESD
jgi:catechol 2,3-dioxygenase-like lactoylglutathione lyase family enzyme